MYVKCKKTQTTLLTKTL